MTHLARRQSLIGQRFGRLVVLEAMQKPLLCRCDCGTVKEYGMPAVVKGYTRSCGCLRRELTKTRNFRHQKVHPEKVEWSLRNVDLARLYGVSEETIRKHRKRSGKPISKRHLAQINTHNDNTILKNG